MAKLDRALYMKTFVLLSVAFLRLIPAEPLRNQNQNKPVYELELPEFIKEIKKTEDRLNHHLHRDISDDDRTKSNQVAEQLQTLHKTFQNITEDISKIHEGVKVLLLEGHRERFKLEIIQLNQLGGSIPFGSDRALSICHGIDDFGNQVKSSVWQRKTPFFQQIGYAIACFFGWRKCS